MNGANGGASVRMAARSLADAARELRLISSGRGRMLRRSVSVNDGAGSEVALMMGEEGTSLR
jgi:hypothetical protein